MKAGRPRRGDCADWRAAFVRGVPSAHRGREAARREGRREVGEAGLPGHGRHRVLCAGNPRPDRFLPAAPSPVRRGDRRHPRRPVRRGARGARGNVRRRAVRAGPAGTAGAGRAPVRRARPAPHASGAVLDARGVPAGRRRQAAVVRRRPAVPRAGRRIVRFDGRTAVLRRSVLPRRPAGGRRHLPARRARRGPRPRPIAPSEHLQQRLPVHRRPAGRRARVRGPPGRHVAGALARPQGAARRAAAPEPVLRRAADVRQLHLQLPDPRRCGHPRAGGRGPAPRQGAALQHARQALAPGHHAARDPGPLEPARGHRLQALVRGLRRGADS